DRDNYWKMMHKYIGSDVTSLVTLPVIIFEPMTMLQKMAELMEYCELLDKADECEDPYMRMVYASTWAVSVYFAYQRTWKPFNLILGETYEMVNHQGITFLAEQVSHHPPMGVAHCENEHFTYDITSKVKTKFLGNSLEFYPVGRTRVTLKKSGVVLDLVPPLTKVNNLIFGRTWVDSPGEMVMTNLTIGDKVVLYFQPCGWFDGPDGVSTRNVGQHCSTSATRSWSMAAQLREVAHGIEASAPRIPSTRLLDVIHKQPWIFAQAPLYGTSPPSLSDSEVRPRPCPVPSLLPSFVSSPHPDFLCHPWTI
ncbi:hypothetical protein ACJX0J_029002, partial [Zea mays]